MKDLEKLLNMKKQKGSLSEHEKNAKMEVLQELLQMATQAMGSKVKGGMDELKKVSVVAPDKESLTEGLELAKEVAEKAPEITDEVEASLQEEEPTEEESKMDALKALAGKDEDEESDEEENMFAKKPKEAPKKKALFGMDEDEE